ncbi:VOC family protein [Tatumella citrea]|uniref:Glyoxalase n=1 Tax=Tatumella citrea TaxID=53336 RepID=A0A1Y0LHZ6_TATCI|nr:VOC family protein [Tatumella citrea]ARU93694.1 glyoxalase [Tatumella citrea]ARU97732.1 glyoxalase [Tatumella citrea]
MNDAVRFGRIAAVLAVRNIQRAEQFYTYGLNFEAVFKNGNPTGFMILKRDDAELHLTLQPFHKAAAYPVAHLLVDDAEAFFERCRQAGAKIIKGIQDKDYGLRAFVFADHDGNRIDVGQILSE